MMRDSKIRMADIFDLPVTAEQHDEFNGWWTVDTARGPIDESGDGGFEQETAEAIAVALNNHDRLTAENKSLREEVERLRSERDQLKVQVKSLKTGRKWITYCPEDGVEIHNSEDDALKYGHGLIETWLDPDFGWDDDVKQVFVAQITHRAEMVDRVDRPPEDELDENGCDYYGDDWSDPDITCKCNYRLIPVDNCQVEK